VRVKSLLTALVACWAVPVLSQETSGQKNEPSSEQSEKETQVAQAQQPQPQAQGQPSTPSTQAAPSPAAPPSPFTFAFRGFISGSVFVQDGITTGAGGLPLPGQGGLTGLGQGAFLALSEQPTDKLVFGADVRQTRLNFSMRGPQILGGATPTGTVELDFFGGFSGGSFGDESVFPRLRLAYVDLAWPQTTVRVGQFHNLLIGFIPASAAHIGQPYVVATYLGFRAPGVTLLQRMPMGGLSAELALQVNRNNWRDTLGTCGTGTPPLVLPNCLPQGVTFGEASGWPQVQARVALTSGKAPASWPGFPAGDFTVFVAGEWDQKDISGYGVSGGDVFTTYAVQAGAKVAAGPLTIGGNAFIGQNTGGLVGTLGQFAPLLRTTEDGTVVAGENVFDMGGWVQAGVSLTKEFSLWATAGTNRPDRDDLAAALPQGARFKNVYAAMLAYKDGPYHVGLEWIHLMTGLPTREPVNDTRAVNVNQGIATVTYFF
jgi:hypothetical protein